MAVHFNSSLKCKKNNSGEVLPDRIMACSVSVLAFL